MNNKSKEDIEFEKLVYLHIITVIVMVAAVILAEQIILHMDDIQKFYILIRSIMV